MQIGRFGSITGFALQVCGAGATMIWPDQKWIGWALLGIGTVTLTGSALWLFFANYRMRIPWAPRKEPETTPDDLDSDYSNNPEAEAIDKGAYREILAFSLDKLLPACAALLALAEAVVSANCSNDTIAYLAIDGLRKQSHHKTSDFIEQYFKLLSGLSESPGPIIKFEAIIDCIYVLEGGAYNNFRERHEEIFASTGVEQKQGSKGYWLAPVAQKPGVNEYWFEWAEKHNALIDAYESIKRDPRFGKLLRPARPSRWGDKIDTSIELIEKGSL